MHVDRNTLLKFLAENNISFEMQEHPPVYTMAESEKLSLSLAGARCKNLFVQNKKQTERFLLVVQGDASVDLSALGKMLGVGRLSLCSPEQLMQHLGVAPGSATPFSLLKDKGIGAVRLVLQREVAEEDALLLHPMVNTATLRILSADFRRFVEATGHQAEVVQLPQREIQPG